MFTNKEEEVLKTNSQYKIVLKEEDSGFEVQIS